MSEIVKVDLQQVIDGLGETLPVPRSTRADRKRKWQVARRLDGDERALVGRLADVVGAGPTLDEPGELSDEEVASLMGEALDIRAAQDLLSGRHDAIRLTVFHALDHRGPEGEAGELHSPEHLDRSLL